VLEPELDAVSDGFLQPKILAPSTQAKATLTLEKTVSAGSQEAMPRHDIVQRRVELLRRYLLNRHGYGHGTSLPTFLFNEKKRLSKLDNVINPHKTLSRVVLPVRKAMASSVTKASG
jgi:cAMP phosphodiesterase